VTTSIFLTYLSVFLLLSTAILLVSGIDKGIAEEYRRGTKAGALRLRKQTLLRKLARLEEKRRRLVEDIRIPKPVYRLLTGLGALGGAVIGKVFFQEPFFTVVIGILGPLGPLLFLSYKLTQSKSEQVDKLRVSMMLLSGSYIVTEDFVKSVQGNIDLLEYPAPFREFLTYVSLIDGSVKTGLRRMENQVENLYFSQWIDVLIMAQDDRSLKYVTMTIVDAMNDVHQAQRESDTVSNGLWCWWSRGIGGRTALDYLTQVRGLDFIEAVGLILCDSPFSFPAQSRSPPAMAAPKFLVLPERNDNNRRMFAYLCSRGIDPEIINHCIKHGQLYEEREHHNAVFVGFDGDQPRCASMRSTLSDSTFLRDAEGSDKRFSFSFASDNNGALVVTESAIDLLSYLTLIKQNRHDWRMVNGVSLTGIYKPREDTPIVPVALAQYLKDHPQIRRIALCLDNDEAGREAAQGIIAALPELEVTYRPPANGKDYNDMLCEAKGVKNNIRMRGENVR
jgi:hypothetical protein